jgi:Tfp pilus assembly protein PilF
MPTIMDPQIVQQAFDLALEHHRAGRLDLAIASYQRAIQLKPDHAESFNNLGNALKEKGRLDQAMDCYRQAIKLKPHYPDAQYNLALALAGKGSLEEAIGCFRLAIQLKPDFAEAHSNLGNALWFTGQIDQATQQYQKALALNPDLPEAHLNLGVVHLAQGDYQRGWLEYDWRLKIKRPGRLPPFQQPRWDGKPLHGRTLLIHAEQGFGDSIFFSRYIPRAAQSGARLILGCQPELARLLSKLARFEQIATSPSQLPPFDVHCPLPSLPLVMGLRGPDDVPWTGPYLKSDPETRRKFSDFIQQAGRKLKVGLCWSGGPTPPGRSIPLPMLAPLANPNVQFYSLQIGQASIDAKSPPPGMNLIDPTPRITDFSDTAALIDQLDLVVSIDTAAAQLAAALGQPVLTLLNHASDWRWLLAREDSPWYPTMRLFRQQSAGDWQTVIARVASEILHRTNARK